MRRPRFRFLWLGLVALASGAAQAGSTVSEADIRAVIERSLPYLAKEGQWWIDDKKCASCHHTTFLIWSHNLAAERGFDVDLDRLEGWRIWTREHLVSNRPDGKPGLVGETNVEGLSEMILGGDPGSFVEFVPTMISTQQKDGSWKPGGQLPTQRRPAAETVQASTMWNAIALDLLGAGAEQREQALKLLRDSPIEAKSTEWFALRVMLETRFGDPLKVEAATRQLLARQNDDGGWSWVDGDPSDAMATGQALFGLSEAGVSPSDESVQRAWAFLASSQREDGGWTVNSTKARNRGKSDRISDFFGSAWATIGLLRGLPES